MVNAGNMSNHSMANASSTSRSCVTRNSSFSSNSPSQPSTPAEGQEKSPGAGVSDMTILQSITMSTINENLRLRYESGQIYTYTGTILIAVNPYKELPIYETDHVFKYSGQGLKISQSDPHVFAIAEAAYSSLESRNQSCVISGESGAGKTESTKFILQYLCTVTSNESTWMEHQILEANTILESFGNAKTVRNDNSSRFGKFIQVCFDHKFLIKGCIIQDYLLEQSRITFQSRGERNYHVLYQLAAAAAKSPEIRDKFMMESGTASYVYLCQSECCTIDGVDDGIAFDNLRLAMSVLNMTPVMQEGIFSVLSAVLWLGNLKFEEQDEGERSKLTSEDEEILAIIATLLGIDAIQLTQVSIQRQINVRGTITEIPFKIKEARENRHAMSKCLYSRAFAWIVHFINTCTSPANDAGAQEDLSSIRFLGVLDIFGFENFAHNSFEQLCINYANEKLQRFFNHYVFSLEQEMYKSEGICVTDIQFIDNTECLELLEKPPKCIFRLLTEECRMPKGSDQTYLAKIHAEFGTSCSHYVKGEDKRRWDQEFGIKHYAGDVIYAAHGFLDKNKDAQQDTLFDLMAHSVNAFVKDLVRFQDLLGVTGSTSVPGAKVKLTHSNSFRGIASASAPTGCSNNNNNNTLSGKMNTSKGRTTVADAFRLQLTSLVDLLHTTNPWYVRCIKPNISKTCDLYDEEAVVSQLKYLGMLDIIRIRREGFPINMTFDSFTTRYKCLLKSTSLTASLANGPGCSDPCIKILSTMAAISKLDWQVGRNRIFLRFCVYEPLEERRSKVMIKSVTVIQSCVRGWIRAVRYQRMRMSAILMQRVFRKFRARLQSMRRERAVVTIQAFVRGMFAREVATAMRQMKRVNEDCEAKRHQLEQQQVMREGPAAASLLSVVSGISDEDSFAWYGNDPESRLSMAPSEASGSTITATSHETGNDSNSDNNITVCQGQETQGRTVQPQQNNHTTSSSISQQFDQLISSTQAHLSQLEADHQVTCQPNHPHQVHHPKIAPAVPIRSSFTSHNGPQRGMPHNKPTQEVAPILMNRSSPCPSSPSSSHHSMNSRFERPVYAPVVSMNMNNCACSPDLRSNGSAFQRVQNGGMQQQQMQHGANNRKSLTQQGVQQQEQQEQESNMSQAGIEERRKERIARKMIQIQKDQDQENISINSQAMVQNQNKSFEMIDFAEKYFNHHVRDSHGSHASHTSNTSSSSSLVRTLTLTRRKSSQISANEDKDSSKDYLLKSEMLQYTGNQRIPTSHIRMRDQQNTIIACSLFRDLQKYSQGGSKGMKAEMEVRIIQGIIRIGIDREEVRDEIYCQLMRQMSSNPSKIEVTRNWILLGLVSASFNPGKVLQPYVNSFLHKYLRQDAETSCYAQFCIDNMMHKSYSISSSSCRRCPPSRQEIQAVKSLSGLVFRVHFMDGSTKSLDVHPCDTAADAMSSLAAKISLRSPEGWAIYNHAPDLEKVIKSHEFLADVIYCWESESVEGREKEGKDSKAGKEKDKSGSTGAASEVHQFILKKRLFRKTREIPRDPVEVNLLYAQAVHAVVRRDEYLVSERIALQLAGLQAQISLGEYEACKQHRYDNTEDYLCPRIRRHVSFNNRNKTDWQTRIADAHRMYGSGKADLIAKVWYLSVVMQYPLYGTTLFKVNYKGYHQMLLIQQKQPQQTPHHVLLIGVNCEGVFIINPNDKSILNAYPYQEIESISLFSGNGGISDDNVNHLITIKLISNTSNRSTDGSSSKFFTFESREKEEIVNLITSYCPTLNPFNNRNNMMMKRTAGQGMPVSGGVQQQQNNRRVLKLSLEDRMKFHRELMNCRRVLIESGRLRKDGNADDSTHESPAGIFSTLRKFNKKSANGSEGTSFKKSKNSHTFDSDVFRSFPHSYWAFTTDPIDHSLMLISDPEQECDSVNNFNLILAYSGLQLMSDMRQEDIYDDRYSIYEAAKTCNGGAWSSMSSMKSDPIALVQRMIGKVVQKEGSDIFKNEFFLQLIKQTTDHPEPNSLTNVKHWQLLGLACSMTYPTDRRILSYLHAHLRKCSLDQVTEEGLFASFSLKNLQGSLETRGRRVQPSRAEVISTINRRRCHARIYFLDAQFQAVEFDSCATISEVIEQIQLKTGLRPMTPGYALYQMLGDVKEQSIDGDEKVGDALSSWERFHSSLDQGSSKQHYFIFKKHLFLDKFIDLTDKIEKELLFHQMVYNIRSDRFPVSDLEAILLTALKAQIDLGDYRDPSQQLQQQQDLYSIEYTMSLSVDYQQILSSILPPRLQGRIQPEEIGIQHQTMKGMDQQAAKSSFFNLVRSWPLYRCTMFDVSQTYTSVWPKNLWFAVDPDGIYLMECRTRNLLFSCSYGHLIEYSHSDANLMIVTSANQTNGQPIIGQRSAMSGGSSKTCKYLFLSQHSVQIATLIRDYTRVLGVEKGIRRRKSVEFDISTRNAAGVTFDRSFNPTAQQGNQAMTNNNCQPQQHLMRKACPPLPPPRPSIYQRQQHMMSIAEQGNAYYDNTHSMNMSME